MSSKKKKRLDAYVNRKLKKEGRKDLIASLACVYFCILLELRANVPLPCSTTQTLNLSLRSSSSLGSKQYETQGSKLEHGQSVEERRRIRARGILKKVKGRGHLSEEESGGDEGDSEEGSLADDEDMADVPAPPRSTTTLDSKKLAPVFNASGSLGVVHVTPAPSSSTLPTATTSNHNSADATSARPPIAPALIPAKVGSGLKEGVVMTIVKRKPKVKGRLRAMAGKGKGKAVEEDEDSDFDSSDSAMDEVEKDEKSEKGDSDEESWGGIESENEGVPAIQGGKDDANEDEDDDSSSYEDDGPARPPREKGAFQAWAESQVLSAAGLTSSLPAPPSPSADDTYTPLLPAGAGAGFQSLSDPTGVTGPLGSVIPTNQLPTLPPQRSTHIPIERTEEMQKQREELPIVKEEDRIMDAIRGNPVIVICGETGSGKTTQIGQFLWEAGWGDKSSGSSFLYFVVASC